jgi:cofilin
MSNTGVSVNQAVITEFNEFKLRGKFRYMVFKLNNTNEEVVIDKTGAPGAPYSEFLAALPDNDCRYAVYNAEYTTDDGERAKFVFFLWAPDSAKVKAKMLYAGTKDTVKKSLQGLQVEVQENVLMAPSSRIFSWSRACGIRIKNALTRV